MSDDQRPPRYRRPLSVGGREPPSGRWTVDDFDDDAATPPPVDPEDRRRWERQRDRLSLVEGMIHRSQGRFDVQELAISDLTRRVGVVEAQGHQTSSSVNTMSQQLALLGQSTTMIERGVARLEQARDSDGARARHIIQIAAAFAALAVSIVSIITR